MKVDLPAPLAPTSPCTSPLRSSKLIPRSAGTPGKDFDTLRTRIATVELESRMRIGMLPRAAVSFPIARSIANLLAPSGVRDAFARTHEYSSRSVHRPVLVGVGLADENGTGGIDDLRKQFLIDVGVDRLAIQRHHQRGGAVIGFLIGQVGHRGSPFAGLDFFDADFGRAAGEDADILSRYLACGHHGLLDA